MVKDALLKKNFTYPLKPPAVYSVLKSWRVIDTVVQYMSYVIVIGCLFQTIVDYEFRMLFNLNNERSSDNDICF